MTDQMPPPLPEDYRCEPGTVPGWLNSDGLPTSCVGDDPLTQPELTPPIATDTPSEPSIGVPITATPTAPRELAATGAEWILVAAIMATLLAVGFALLTASRLSAKPRYKRH